MDTERQTIDTDRPSALCALLVSNADFLLHVHAVGGRALVCERPIEPVAVVRDDDVRTHGLDVVEEAAQHPSLVLLVEDVERAGVLGLGRVLEVGHVFGHVLATQNQISLAVKHVRDHKNFVHVRVRELERSLRTLDVEGQDPGLDGLHAVF